MVTHDRTRLTGPLMFVLESLFWVDAVKLRVKAEDFLVVEKPDVRELGHGDFHLYELRKYGWNTTDVLDRVARRAGIPRSYIAYGGRKDRWATTVQFITASPHCTRDLSDTHGTEGDGSPFYTLRRVGDAARHMAPSLILGNEFKIVVRCLSAGEQKLVLDRIGGGAVPWGYPNYFDDQRFRGASFETGFPAERLLRRQWRGAMQSILGAWGYLKRVRDDWDDWDAVLPLVSEPWLRRICNHLKRDPGDYLGALRLVPPEELSMMFSAYQGFLWNELLRRVLIRMGLRLSSYPGDVSDYLFYEVELNPTFDRAVKRLANTKASLPAAKASFSDELFQREYVSLLAERGLRPSSFNLRQLRQAFFKAVIRPAVVFPADFRHEGPEPDELHPEGAKITLHFRLPRGSYGTMLVKRLFAT